MIMSGLDPIGDHYGPTYLVLKSLKFISCYINSLDPIGDRPINNFKIR